MLNRIVQDIANGRSLGDPEVRKQVGYLEAGISIVANVLLFVIKLAVGLSISSITVMADAFHTLSDVVSSVVVWLGFRWSSKCPDKEHPFGHGRLEYIAGIVVALLLVGVGIEFCVVSFDKIRHPMAIPFSGVALAVVGLTILVKEWQTQVAFRLGKLIDSQALIADAWHHRTDALSSIVAIVAVMMNMAGFVAFDAFGGMILGIFIIYTGLDLGRQFVDSLIGKAPPEGFLAALQEVVQAHPKVEGIHDVVVHRYGAVRAVSFHIELDENLTFLEAHDIAELLEKEVAESMNLSSVTIHIDPYSRRFGRYPDLARDIERVIENIACVNGYHDLRIHAQRRVRIDLTILPETSARDIEEARRCFTDGFRKIYPQLDLQVKIEPVFHYQLSAQV